MLCVKETKFISNPNAVFEKFANNELITHEAFARRYLKYNLLSSRIRRLRGSLRIFINQC